MKLGPEEWNRLLKEDSENTIYPEAIADSCEECLNDEDPDTESKSYVPHAIKLDESMALYQCKRGHRWPCWWLPSELRAPIIP